VTGTTSARHRELLERRNLGYAVHFVLDCTMNGNEGRTEPTDENLAHVLRSCARRPKPEEYASIRRHVEEYRATQAAHRQAILRLAAQMADFSRCPPEENTTDGECGVCCHPVQAHQGMFAAAAHGRGGSGVHLHRGCLAQIKQARSELSQAE
jgi:hypothetical protein